ncbi:hypothetical protein ATSB10_35830 [Dyella thiooxydans]|uniref:Uncharacterized protein n=1 Tax=Dyella thiooxydans TaxID=445710 RepID=A0A160N520_9GAMM|nr:hypothetical protein [Dyella thiooxydans]AND71037.1 hypothetical protein ATSB10_35830 [Dyella thiooxydans]
MKTNLHTVLCTSIRLGAVLLAVHALEDAATVVAAADGNTHRLFASLLFDAWYLAVGVVLWLWPGALAWWASSRSGGQVLEAPIGADELQRVALSVLGVWQVVQGVSGLLSHGVVMVFLHDRMTDYSTGHLPPAEWRWVVFYVLQALAGAAVALGAAGMVNLFHRLRRFPEASPATTEIDADAVR